MLDLQTTIEKLYAEGAAALNDPAARSSFERFRDALTAGTIRAAEKFDGAWQTNAWVKKGILVGFRIGKLAESGDAKVLRFVDKDTYPIRRFTTEDRVRVVPGGSSVRAGAYVAPSVVCMPPMYINVGAYVDEGSMVDSHALVGSCAQVGKRVHISAAAQIGGVLEPAGARPVVVEDDAFVGGLVGLFEGIVVRKRAVLASGVVITGSSIIYDLVNGRELRREVPEGAVVVPGSRPASGDYAKAHGLQLAAPCIVKYRDDKTDAATALEQALR
jgi:2,3,4,5-tetrahydropyridine-2-carboxylate N-succinyltransferase